MPTILRSSIKIAIAFLNLTSIAFFDHLLIPLRFFIASSIIIESIQWRVSPPTLNAAVTVGAAT
jgi:hypothetical protein